MMTGNSKCKVLFWYLKSRADVFGMVCYDAIETIEELKHTEPQKITHQFSECI